MVSGAAATDAAAVDALATATHGTVIGDDTFEQPFVDGQRARLPSIERNEHARVAVSYGSLLKRLANGRGPPRCERSVHVQAKRLLD